MCKILNPMWTQHSLLQRTISVLMNQIFGLNFENKVLCMAHAIIMVLFIAQEIAQKQKGGEDGPTFMKKKMNGLNI